MAICKTASYRVQPASLRSAKAAIRKFVSHVRASEPGTLFYAALQDKADPTRFLHVMVFRNKAAEDRHASSGAMKRFTGFLYPKTAGGVWFTDYVRVASK